MPCHRDAQWRDQFALIGAKGNFRYKAQERNLSKIRLPSKEDFARCDSLPSISCLFSELWHPTLLARLLIMWHISLSNYDS